MTLPNTIPPVGPERDRAVAELLGCTTWDSKDDGTGWWGCFCGREQHTDIFPHDAAVRCSTDPAAAFEALELWRQAKPGRAYRIDSPWDEPEDRNVVAWRVILFERDVERAAYEAPTFPAAATAALLAEDTTGGEG